MKFLLNLFVLGALISCSQFKETASKRELSSITEGSFKIKVFGTGNPVENIEINYNQAKYSGENVLPMDQSTLSLLSSIDWGTYECSSVIAATKEIAGEQFLLVYGMTSNSCEYHEPEG